jgi:uncharacterized protein YcnI
MTAALSPPKKLIYSVLAAGGLAVALATPAMAHVEIDPSTAAQGGESTFTFQVPNEQPTAGTVKLEVSLPTAHPILEVRTKPLPGWTAQITKRGDAVSLITWVAQPGTRINPGEFQEFEVAAGPLPKDTDLLVLPVRQTYDDGQVVVWDEPPGPEGAPEPEHPAPTLKLLAAAGAGEHATGHGAAGPTVTGSTVTGESSHPDLHTTDSTARWLGGAGLILGALGLGLGAGAVLRIRRGSSA